MKRKVLFAGLSLFLLILSAIALLVWCGKSDHLGKADIALVLGNTVNRDGSPSPRLKARLDTAVSLFESGYFQKIAVSGGTGKEGIPEGTAMKHYLISKGIPDSAIVVDNQGVNTFASAQNIAAILKAEQMKSVLVITQYFHIPRSKLALSKFGISPIFNSHPRYFESRDVYSTLRELPAYLEYLFRNPKPKSGI